MSTIKANKWENLDGTENYKCRAWVNFDGTTTPPTIRASGNVSSVVRNSNGDYTINFTTPLVDADYSVVALPFNASNDTNSSLMHGSALSQPTQFSVRLGAWNIVTAGAGSNARLDPPIATVAIFR